MRENSKGVYYKPLRDVRDCTTLESRCKIDLSRDQNKNLFKRGR